MTPRQRVLAALDRVAPAAAWGLLIGATVTFVGVVSGLIVVGEFRLGTLLIAASLMLEGWSNLRDEQQDGDV